MKHVSSPVNGSGVYLFGGTLTRYSRSRDVIRSTSLPRKGQVGRPSWADLKSIRISLAGKSQLVGDHSLSLFVAGVMKDSIKKEFNKDAEVYRMARLVEDGYLDRNQAMVKIMQRASANFIRLRSVTITNRYFHAVLHEGTRTKSVNSDTRLIKSILVQSELTDAEVAHCYLAMSFLGML